MDQIGNKQKSTFNGKKQNRVNFIEIKTIQTVFMYKNYLSITLSSKVEFTTKSEL